MYGNVIADRSTWNNNTKTVGGNNMILIATQKSRRTLRKGKTKYIYLRQGSGKIYYNQSKGGVYYSPIAVNAIDMKKYLDVFINPPLTTPEKEWLNLNDYEMVS